MNLLRIASFLTLVSGSFLAMAQDYPTKPIKLIVATNPGGSPDLFGRLMAQSFSTLLGQPMTVENIPGAGGITGMRTVIKSPPDGYTLIFTDNGKWAIAPALQRGIYDASRDLAPIGIAVTNLTMIVVHESFPAKNLQEFIAAVKAKPGFYHYGSSGNGSVHHLSMEAFKAAYGLDMVHVPYKGAGQSSAALLAGQIGVVIAGPVAIQSQLKSGQVRAIANTSKHRFKFIPDLPSMADAGASDLDFKGDLAYFAPAGTPRPIIDKLAATMARIMQQPDIVAKVEAVGSEPFVTGPEELARLVKADIERYNKAVKASGMKVD